MNALTPSLQLSNSQPLSSQFYVRLLDNADYQSTHEAMLNHTLQRIEDKKAGKNHPDELWIVEHQDVYTLGQAGKAEHILYRTDTPIIQTDRGGQVTWHGYGQLVVYWLFDLHRLGFGVRDLVSHAEQAIEDVLSPYLPSSLYAKSRRDAPGVYIYNHDGDMLGKIASLGFKIKQGFSYHGVAINLVNNLTAFDAINPCGYAGMPMAKLESFGQFDKQHTGEFIKQFIKNIAERHAGLVELRPQDTLK
ncbi:lipoyl(octanoyl) transferase [Moraxella cuniculi DSM 21768]|uniref:Octanoyltransferase n=1 Tax=Moraxella cuniculi DSM 21768 TaxID=1122245 RepID=A0A1N7EGY1_9GAMM|nr:lipoyl(octanoyl) transferase [Moraxella cuniculi]SIR87361.1 lipoyl(octanoyl) transferase [Moraxella cuniculi DSM 21768]